LRIGIVRGIPDPEVNDMPRPYRGTITSKTGTNALIRPSKSEFIRRPYAQLGPIVFYRRRLDWSHANGKTTS
jgi:hypothetical protein